MCLAQGQPHEILLRSSNLGPTSHETHFLQLSHAGSITIFQSYSVSSLIDDGCHCTYLCFLRISLVLCAIFFPSNWLRLHITIVEKTYSVERGISPVMMAIINPRTEYWPSRGSNQRLPVLHSYTLPTGLCARSLTPRYSHKRMGK